tara:strand:- start:401 stop:532 length:132 start_codon:yes stop_codon:yes gene_type:complete
MCKEEILSHLSILIPISDKLIYSDDVYYEDLLEEETELLIKNK